MDVDNLKQALIKVGYVSENVGELSSQGFVGGSFIGGRISPKTPKFDPMQGLIFADKNEAAASFKHIKKLDATLEKMPDALIVLGIREQINEVLEKAKMEAQGIWGCGISKQKEARKRLIAITLTEHYFVVNGRTPKATRSGEEFGNRASCFVEGFVEVCAALGLNTQGAEEFPMNAVKNLRRDKQRCKELRDRRALFLAAITPQKISLRTGKPIPGVSFFSLLGK